MGYGQCPWSRQTDQYDLPIKKCWEITIHKGVVSRVHLRSSRWTQNCWQIDTWCKECVCPVKHSHIFQGCGKSLVCDVQNLAIHDTLDLYEPTVYWEGCSVDIGGRSDGDLNIDTLGRKDCHRGSSEAYISKVRCQWNWTVRGGKGAL